MDEIIKIEKEQEEVKEKERVSNHGGRAWALTEFIGMLLFFPLSIQTSSFPCSSQISPSRNFFIIFYSFSHCSSHCFTAFYQVEDDRPRFAETDDGWWIELSVSTRRKSSTQLKLFLVTQMIELNWG